MFRARERLLVATVEDPLKGDEALQPGDADEETETMSGQDPADLPITLGLRLGSDGSQPSSDTL